MENKELKELLEKSKKMHQLYTRLSLEITPEKYKDSWIFYYIPIQNKLEDLFRGWCKLGKSYEQDIAKRELENLLEVNFEHLSRWIIEKKADKELDDVSCAMFNDSLKENLSIRLENSMKALRGFYVSYDREENFKTVSLYVDFLSKTSSENIEHARQAKESLEKLLNGEEILDSGN